MLTRGLEKNALETLNDSRFFFPFLAIYAFFSPHQVRSEVFLLQSHSNESGEALF